MFSLMISSQQQGYQHNSTSETLNKTSLMRKVAPECMLRWSQRNSQHRAWQTLSFLHSRPDRMLGATTDGIAYSRRSSPSLSEIEGFSLRRHPYSVSYSFESCGKLRVIVGVARASDSEDKHHAAFTVWRIF